LICWRVQVMKRLIMQLSPALTLRCTRKPNRPYFNRNRLNSVYNINMNGSNISIFWWTVECPVAITWSHMPAISFCATRIPIRCDVMWCDVMWGVNDGTTHE
jgi:hypothetical protein